MPALVVDLGGTRLRCAIARDGRLDAMRRCHVENYLGGHTPEQIWDSVASRIAAYHSETLDLLPPDAPLALAFPGPIALSGRILDAPTLVGPNAPIPDLQADLRARTGRPVSLLNDVSAAAWYLSARTRARRFLVITVSSGIGSKLFDRDHPAGVIDDPPYAGEIGHVVVDSRADAPLCGCGGRGHLGAISSGRGTERLARERAGLPALTNEEHLAPAARRGEAWALDVVRAAAQPLARTVVTLITACGLEKVFLFGGFAESIGPAYLEIVRDLAFHACQYPVLQPCIRAMIEMPEAEDETCLRGAAIFAARGIR
jgi:predicted NBD/HSP70 family sugar kinase